jgi:phosphatidylserine decarboxylase
MSTASVASTLLVCFLILIGAYVFWRYYWFWRNPERHPPPGDGLVSPADGTVVYVVEAAPNEPIISCKQGVAASINDIAREDLNESKILIGIFMSPFGVHYNRAPMNGTIMSVSQYPAIKTNLHMSAMHFFTLIGRHPMYAHSGHIVENNRAVTHLRGEIRGQTKSCYIVQIGGGSVNGIDVYPKQGETIKRGEVYGMIRIGSQVDVIFTREPNMRPQVSPGDKVRAGETVVIG